MFYLSFGSSSSAQATSAPPATPTLAPLPRRDRNARATRPGKQNSTKQTNSLDPRLHLNLLTETENMQYSGNGRNIFKANAEEPMPKIEKQVASPFKKPEPQHQIAEGPRTPPPPPPIPLKFFGFATQQGNKKVVLLSGDDVFVATEGEIVQRRYKIMKINANNIEVLDVLNNNRQTIPLTAG
jgi:hypothetical protein